MDRETLVRRNQQLTEAFHQIPVQHRLRQVMLEMASQFPFSPLTRGWNRILFIRPDHLGDMLLSVPALRALKQARPYMEIHMLASPSSASILANVPEIDLVLTINFPGFGRNQEKKSIFAPYFQLFRTARQLRQIGYGHAVIMRPDHWWGAMLAHFAGISERIGYDKENVAPFLTHALPHQHEHVVRQNLRLVENWTGTIADDDVPFHMQVYDKERLEIDNHLRTCSISEKQPIFCIHPGSGQWVKLWEVAKWAQVADTLIEQLDAAVVFTGGDGERQMVTQIQNWMQHKSCNTAGEINLEQLSALYERAIVVLGPDSGPLHLAAAVNAPTVALYGPADPIEFGTWGDPQHHAILTTPIGCRPCRVLDWVDDDPNFHPCVREITVGQVLEAARRVVNQE